MSSRPPPQHTEHMCRELWCGGNQHLPEKRVRENVVSCSVHHGLGRSPSRQRMFRNLQAILSIYRVREHSVWDTRVEGNKQRENDGRWKDC